MKDNIFYNHITSERIDMIDKLAYLYWYEHFNKDGWTNNKHKEVYILVKNEVMEYGYKFFKDSRD